MKANAMFNLEVEKEVIDFTSLNISEFFLSSLFQYINSGYNENLISPKIIFLADIMSNIVKLRFK